MGEPQPALRAAQLVTVSEAQKLVPRKTGFLQRNIKPGRISRTSATVEARTPYAAAVEFGTRPHIIRPKNAKVLAWGGPRRLSGRLRKGAKATNFAMIVHHPGTRAQPYLLPGARIAVGRIRDAIVKLWNEAA
jgi:hypothetical protein